MNVPLLLSHPVLALPPTTRRNGLRSALRLRPFELLCIFSLLWTLATHASGQQAANPNRVALQARRVDFHLLDGIVMTVDQMEGAMLATPGKAISLDDRTSFTVAVRGAVTRLSSENLTALLNEYLLPRADSPIKHVSVRFDGQSAIIQGEVRKLVPMPFEARAVLSPTPAGELRVHVLEFRAAGVVTKGFLDFLGIRLDKLAAPRQAQSFRIDGDDLIVPMRSLFPPPLLSAQLTAVRIEGNWLIETLGRPHALPAPPQPAPNYVYFRGGRMHFGKMTMEDVDLELIDKRSLDNFDFSLDRYLDQIGAGYTRLRPNLGLTAYAEDYRSLPPKPAPRP